MNPRQQTFLLSSGYFLNQNMIQLVHVSEIYFLGALKERKSFKASAAFTQEAIEEGASLDLAGKLKTALFRRPNLLMYKRRLLRKILFEQERNTFRKEGLWLDGWMIVSQVGHSSQVIIHKLLE